MNWKEPKVYAVKHKDSMVRALSRSGGIFTAISDHILKDNGVVYGCILTEQYKAIHVRSTTADERDQMRGSKYIQSKMGDTYKHVKIDLDSGRNVLFSGTSCQIAGLKGFLCKEYNNLICLDIVCHGVPSPKVWDSYLKWQEKKNGGSVSHVDFRNKKAYGWAAHVESLVFDNGKNYNGRIFTTLFYGHCILRPSCYTCPYKSTMHPGDITIADYWGIDQAAPGFNDNRGVSLVLINNDKGMRIFNAIKCNVVWKETNIEDSLQPPLIKAFPEPLDRIQFWNDYKEKSFEYIAKHYGGSDIKSIIKNKIKLRLMSILN